MFLKYQQQVSWQDKIPVLVIPQCGKLISTRNFHATELSCSLLPAGKITMHSTFRIFICKITMHRNFHVCFISVVLWRSRKSTTHRTFPNLYLVKLQRKVVYAGNITMHNYLGRSAANSAPSALKSCPNDTSRSS